MSEQSVDVDEQGRQSFPASDPPSPSPPIEESDPRRMDTLDEDEPEEDREDDEELERESQTQGDIP